MNTQSTSESTNNLSNLKETVMNFLNNIRTYHNNSPIKPVVNFLAYFFAVLFTLILLVRMTLTKALVLFTLIFSFSCALGFWKGLTNNQKQQYKDKASSFFSKKNNQ